MKVYSRMMTGLLIFILIGSFPASGVAQNFVNYYKQGKQAAEQENFKKALTVWLKGKANLEIPQTRIGVAFIELVTEEDLEEYYEFAGLMYEWGLSAQKVNTNKKALRRVIERIAVLVEHEQYRHWDEMLENNNPDLYGELRQFWKRLDITPATTYNERLIEHWQRINYAQKHFTESKYEPFGTDGRGKIYVRYGEPHYKTEGTLEYTMSQAKQYIMQLAHIGMTRPNPQAIHKRVRHTADKVRDYHRSPEYELWVYYSTEYRKQKLVFLFGDAGPVTGGFRLVETVADLIPRSAFSTTKKPSFEDYLETGIEPFSYIAPGLVLQILYYKQLSHLDIYYRKLFITVLNKAKNQQSTNKTLAINVAGQARFKNHVIKTRAPQKGSDIAHRMADIPVKVYGYRMLSRANQPVLLTFIASKPYQALWVDYINNYATQHSDSTLNNTERKNVFKYYQYTHTIQLYNKNGTLINEARNAAGIVKDNRPSVSVSSIPVIGRKAYIVVTAKLENYDSSSAFAIPNLPFPASLRGLGTLRMKLPAPLDSDKSRLQMGDLILGFNYQSSGSKNTYFPFTVANNHTIPEGETLVVHIEVYHLQQNANGFGKLKLSYQIKPDEGFLGFLDKDQQPLQLTFNLETQTSRYIENLRIKTRKLPPGNYTLVMTAGDKLSSQKVKRKFEFDIVDGTP